MESANLEAPTRKLITNINDVRTLVAKHRGQRFSADTETSGLSFRRDRLLGIALYFEDNSSYYIAIEHTMPRWDGTTYLETFLDIPELSFTLSPLFADTEQIVVMHNAKFDMHFLHKSGLYVRGRLFDTLLAAQLLDENRSNGLKELAASMGFVYGKFVDMKKYEGFGSKEILGVPLPQVARYAMNDVRATWMLYERFAQELADEQMQEVFNGIWMPLLPVLQEMEARGIALDLEKVRAIREQQVELRDRLERKLIQVGMDYIMKRYAPEDVPALFYKTHMATEEDMENSYKRDDGVLVTERDGLQHPIITHDMIGKTKAFRPRIVVFNIGSSKQKQALIFQWSGVEIPTEIPLKLTKTGEYSTDKDNIETLIFYAKGDPPEFLQDALDWAKADKFIGTYLDRFLADADPVDNSITTSFNQAVGDSGKGGTKTGRLSSNSPNLMNIPSRGEIGDHARAMFIARPGYKLVVADYSQMELRMMAHYSQDPVLLQAFADGQDLHILTGASIPGITYEELKARYEEGEAEAKKLRGLGKTMNFALNYGMGPLKFKRFLLVNNKVEVSLEEAKQWIEQYNNLYAVATAWKEDVRRDVRRDGYIYTIAGRKRRLPGIYSDVKWMRAYAERQGVNAIIQGSCGDVICESMIHIQPFLRSIGGSLLLQVHDELVSEVPEQHVEMAKAGKELMMTGFINSKLRCPMVAEAKAGDSWYSAKS